jgi:hypothetical protein
MVMHGQRTGLFFAEMLPDNVFESNEGAAIALVLVCAAVEGLLFV